MEIMWRYFFLGTLIVYGGMALALLGVAIAMKSNIDPVGGPILAMSPLLILAIGLLIYITIFWKPS